MTERARGPEGQGGDGGERHALAFIDRRQRYAGRVPVPCEGELLVGDYLDGGDVGDLGGFGDGTGALAALLGLIGGDLAELLSSVRDRDELSRLLLDRGLRDASDTPLGEDH